MAMAKMFRIIKRAPGEKLPVMSASLTLALLPLLEFKFSIGMSLKE